MTEGRLDVDVPELPHLAAALRRFAEERGPLSRTKHQLLTPLVDGPKTPLELFVANQQLEEAPFLGDSWGYLFLYELWEEGKLRRLAAGPCRSPPRGDAATFASTMLKAR